ncbi:hypothetical protein [Roseibium sediminicola]|uniref:Uncharacterized protein n=1 Tax=Roseibium sediminicola TaxID=2933272 RepID=A0ABT0GNH9_9HYPH|nr:hypothetical protein [Roseibium sp. CAU 1639]MCK7610982.1 hypothetical protein [Roseibium sp. CAU 1639]
MNELDRFLLWERLKIWLVAGGVVAVVAAVILGLWQNQSSTDWSVEEVSGTLMHHSRLQDDMGAHKVVLTVQLQDGRTIVVTARNITVPEIGSQVPLVRRYTPYGREKFKLAR